ncbi:MAG: DUF3847 domain-containing protein [Oscillospiraceae bacterium]|nr:DUF3847 domain-containing protein [Oscillospiraceae bacterium]
MSEELEKLNRDIYATQKKLKAAMDKEKILTNEMRRLTRSERTHRLCTRGGMLETFLKEPMLLSDDDVMELLTTVFNEMGVQEKLNILIEKHKNTEETEQG